MTQGCMSTINNCSSLSAHPWLWMVSYPFWGNAPDARCQAQAGHPHQGLLLATSKGGNGCCRDPPSAGTGTAGEGVARWNRPSSHTGQRAGKDEEGEESPPPLKARGQGLSAWLPHLPLAVLSHRRTLSPWTIRRVSWEWGFRLSCQAHRVALPTAEYIFNESIFMRHFCEHFRLSGLWSNQPRSVGVTTSSGSGWPKEREESSSPKHPSHIALKMSLRTTEDWGKGHLGPRAGGQTGSLASMGWMWGNYIIQR